MSRNEAVMSVYNLSCGTQAVLFHETNYEKLESIVRKHCETILNMPEQAFSQCYSWLDVLKLLNLC